MAVIGIDHPLIHLTLRPLPIVPMTEGTVRIGGMTAEGGGMIIEESNLGIKGVEAGVPIATKEKMVEKSRIHTTEGIVPETTNGVAGKEVTVGAGATVRGDIASIAVIGVVGLDLQAEVEAEMGSATMMDTRERAGIINVIATKERVETNAPLMTKKMPTREQRAVATITIDATAAKIKSRAPPQQIMTISTKIKNHPPERWRDTASSAPPSPAEKTIITTIAKMANRRIWGRINNC